MGSQIYDNEDQPDEDYRANKIRRGLGAFFDGWAAWDKNKTQQDQFKQKFDEQVRQFNLTYGAGRADQAEHEKEFYLTRQDNRQDKLNQLSLEIHKAGTENPNILRSLINESGLSDSAKKELNDYFAEQIPKYNAAQDRKAQNEIHNRDIEDAEWSQRFGKTFQDTPEYRLLSAIAPGVKSLYGPQGMVFTAQGQAMASTIIAKLLDPLTGVQRSEMNKYFDKTFAQDIIGLKNYVTSDQGAKTWNQEMWDRVNKLFLNVYGDLYQQQGSSYQQQISALPTYLQAKLGGYDPRKIYQAYQLPMWPGENKRRKVFGVNQLHER